jgi:hypothetical protein
MDLVLDKVHLHHETFPVQLCMLSVISVEYLILGCHILHSKGHFIEHSQAKQEPSIAFHQ